MKGTSLSELQTLYKNGQITREDLDKASWFELRGGDMRTTSIDEIPDLRPQKSPEMTTKEEDIRIFDVVTDYKYGPCCNERMIAKAIDLGGEYVSDKLKLTLSAHSYQLIGTDLGNEIKETGYFIRKNYAIGFGVPHSYSTNLLDAARIMIKHGGTITECWV